MATQYVDIVLAFLTLVVFVGLGPFVYAAIDMAGGPLDPFTATLLQLAVPLLVLGVIVSVGVGARS